MINELWKRNSYGRFGFEIQNQIYTTQGKATTNGSYRFPNFPPSQEYYNTELFPDFANRVGWTIIKKYKNFDSDNRNNNDRFSYKDSIEKIPYGHFPAKLYLNSEYGGINFS